MLSFVIKIYSYFAACNLPFTGLQFADQCSTSNHLSHREMQFKFRILRVLRVGGGGG